jgi:leader peptidase (prepilin peptidase) / N-methyltransferase
VVGSPLVVLVAGLLGGAGGLGLPELVARLPEPVPVAALSDDPVPPEGPPPTKPLYADLAAAEGLRWVAAVASAAAAATLAWRLGWSPQLPVWIYLSVVGVLLAFVDWRTALLPTVVIAPSYAVVAALLLGAAAVTGQWAIALRGLLGWALAGGCFLALWFIHPRGLGYGDVRLSGILGMALGGLGWAELGTGIYAGFLLGGLLGGGLSLLHILDRRRYPFGPFMLAGALAGVLCGPALAGWYAGV